MRSEASRLLTSASDRGVGERARLEALAQGREETIGTSQVTTDPHRVGVMGGGASAESVRPRLIRALRHLVEDERDELRQRCGALGVGANVPPRLVEEQRRAGAGAVARLRAEHPEVPLGEGDFLQP